MTLLYLDFETRSNVDLTKVGAHKYAQDPTTQVLIASFSANGERIRSWVPDYLYGAYPDTTGNDVFFGHLNEVLNSDAGLIVAHNAQFERLILSHCFRSYGYGPEHFPPERFLCSAAIARENGLPSRLEDVARAMQALAGSDVPLKDYRGASLMRMFSMPNRDGVFVDPRAAREQFQAYINYCEQDVRAMIGFLRLLPEYTNHEDYCVNEHINDRGVAVNTVFATRAAEIAAEEPKLLAARVEKLTGGASKNCRGPKLTAWLHRHLPERYKYIMENGEKLTLDAEARLRLMDVRDDLDPPLPDVLDCVHQASSSAASKYQTMVDRANNGRVQGAYLFWGANTGRFSARGLQLHNYPRNVYPPEEAQDFQDRFMLDAVKRSKENILFTLKRLLRSSLVCAPDHVLVGADWAQIEGRLTPWLSIGKTDTASTELAVEKLRQYADPGRDVYCDTASRILGRDVGRKDKERQAYGKVPELALGFGGGVGALIKMAKIYNVKFTQEEAQTVVPQWRAQNAWAQDFWRAVSVAAISAMRNPDATYTAGRISYSYSPRDLNGAGVLYCNLPYGAEIAYPNPRLDGDGQELSYMRCNWSPKQGEAEWPRTVMWHGILVENAVQATAAALLRTALYLLHTARMPIVAHTHDEIILEVPTEEAEAGMEILKSAMQRAGVEHSGLPLEVEAWTGTTYAHGK